MIAPPHPAQLPEYEKMDDNHAYLSRYLDKFSKYPDLSREDEAELSRKIGEGDEKALQTLVEANLRFVVLVSRKYQKSGFPISDLINEGTIGLIEAAKRFNPEKGVKFITYAVWWIRQAILYAIAHKGRIVRLPPKQANLLYTINKTTQNLMQKLGREPLTEEVATEMGVSLEDVESLLRANRSLVSLEASVSGMDGEETGIDIPDENSIQAEDQVIEDAFVDDVELLLTCLDDREKEILEMHFGFKGESKSLQEIGEKFNLTRERIRQIEHRAIKKLKRLAVKRNLHDYLN